MGYGTMFGVVANFTPWMLRVNCSVDYAFKDGTCSGDKTDQSGVFLVPTNTAVVANTHYRLFPTSWCCGLLENRSCSSCYGCKFPKYFGITQISLLSGWPYRFPSDTSADAANVNVETLTQKRFANIGSLTTDWYKNETKKNYEGLDQLSIYREFISFGDTGPVPYYKQPLLARDKTPVAGPNFEVLVSAIEYTVGNGYTSQSDGNDDSKYRYYIVTSPVQTKKISNMLDVPISISGPSLAFELPETKSKATPASSIPNVDYLPVPGYMGSDLDVGIRSSGFDEKNFSTFVHLNNTTGPDNIRLPLYTSGTVVVPKPNEASIPSYLYTLNNDVKLTMDGQTFTFDVRFRLLADSDVDLLDSKGAVAKQYFCVTKLDTTSNSFFNFSDITIYRSVKVVNSTGLAATFTLASGRTRDVGADGTYFTFDEIASATVTFTFPSGLAMSGLSFTRNATDEKQIVSSFMVAADATQRVLQKRFFVDGSAQRFKGGALTLTMPTTVIVNGSSREMQITNVLGTGATPTAFAPITLAANGGFAAVATVDLWAPGTLQPYMFTFKSAAAPGAYKFNPQGGTLTYTGALAPANAANEDMRYKFVTNGPIAPGSDTSVGTSVITVTMPVTTVVNATDKLMWIGGIDTPAVLIPAPSASSTSINTARVPCVDMPYVTVNMARVDASAATMNAQTATIPSNIPTLVYKFPAYTSRTIYTAVGASGNPYIPLTDTPDTIVNNTTSAAAVAPSKKLRHALRSDNTSSDPASYLVYVSGADGYTPAGVLADPLNASTYDPTYLRYSQRYLCNGAAGASASIPTENAYSDGGVVYVTLPTLSVENNMSTSISIDGIDGVGTPIVLPAMTNTTISAAHVPVADLPFVRVHIDLQDANGSNLPAVSDGTNRNVWFVPAGATSASAPPATSSYSKSFMLADNFANDEQTTLVSIDCSQCYVCTKADCCVNKPEDYTLCPAQCRAGAAPVCHANMQATPPCSNQRQPLAYVPLNNYSWTTSCSSDCSQCDSKRFPVVYTPTPPLMLKTGGAAAASGTAFCITGIADTVNKTFFSVTPDVIGAIPVGMSVDAVAGFSIGAVQSAPAADAKLAALTNTRGVGAVLCQTYTSSTAVRDITQLTSNKSLCKDYFGVFDQTGDVYLNAPPAIVSPVPVGRVSLQMPIVRMANKTGTDVLLTGLYNTPPAGVTVANGATFDMPLADFANNQGWTVTISGVVLVPPPALSTTRYLLTTDNNSNTVVVNRYWLGGITANTSASLTNVDLIDSMGACAATGAIFLLENDTLSTNGVDGTTSAVNVVNVTRGATVIAPSLAPVTVPAHTSCIPFCDNSGNTAATDVAALKAPSPAISFSISGDPNTYSISSASKNWLCDGQTPATAKWLYYCTPYVGKYITWQIKRAWNGGVGSFMLTNKLNGQYQAIAQVYGAIAKTTSLAQLPACVNAATYNNTLTSFGVKALDYSGNSNQCTVQGAVGALPGGASITDGGGSALWCGGASYNAKFNNNSTLVVTVGEVNVVTANLSLQEAIASVPNTQMCATYMPAPAQTVPANGVVATKALVGGNIPLYLKTLDWKSFTIEAQTPVGSLEPPLPPLSPTQLFLDNTLALDINWVLRPLASDAVSASGSIAKYKQAVLNLPADATSATPYALVVTTGGGTYTLAVAVGANGYGTSGDVVCTAVADAGSRTAKTLNSLCSSVPLNAALNSTGSVTLTRDAGLAPKLVYRLAAPSPIGTSLANFPSNGYSVTLTNNNAFDVIVTKQQAASEMQAYAVDPTGDQQVIIVPRTQSLTIVGYPDTRYVITDEKGYLGAKGVTSPALKDLVGNQGQWNQTACPYFKGNVYSAVSTNAAMTVTLLDISTTVTFTTDVAGSSACSGSKDTTTITVLGDTAQPVLTLQRNATNPSLRSGSMSFYGSTASLRNISLNITQSNDTNKQGYTVNVGQLLSTSATLLNGRITVTSVASKASTTGCANTSADSSVGLSSTVAINCVWNLSVKLQMPCQALKSRAFVANVAVSSLKDSLTLNTATPAVIATIFDPNATFAITTSYDGNATPALPGFRMLDIVRAASGAAIAGGLVTVSGVSPPEITINCSPPVVQGPGSSYKPGPGPKKSKVVITVLVVIGLLALALLAYYLYTTYYAPAPPIRHRK